MDKKQVHTATEPTMLLKEKYYLANKVMIFMVLRTY